MTNRLNEYLKERPYLGGLVVLGYLLIGLFIWAIIFQPSRSITAIVSDSGLWLAFFLIGPVVYAAYVATSKQTQ